MRRPGRQLRFSDASAWYIPRAMRLPSCVILVTAASLAGTALGASRPDELWIDPLERAALLFSAADEHDRPYSVPARPRDLAGFIALSCEYQEGRPAATESEPPWRSTPKPAGEAFSPPRPGCARRPERTATRAS